MKPPFRYCKHQVIWTRPVSAFAKLAPFSRAFCSRASKAASASGRYSFIGFGDVPCEVRLDERGLRIGANRRGAARTGPLLDALRAALAARAGRSRRWRRCRSPGGLVGYTAYDMVRFFERCRHCRPAANAACHCCITSRRARCWCSII
jgi:anthranilate synthase component I